MAEKPYFFDFTSDGLVEYLHSNGEPGFRSTQVWKAFYHDLSQSPVEVSTLPKPLRQKLKQDLDFSHLTSINRLVSSDGQTMKTLFQLPDSNAIEAVLMKYDERNTLCISSQAGCAMGCVFCATGQMGFRRNLTSGEIVEQVLFYARDLAKQHLAVTNIVVMGMGEPFHNYESVMKAIDCLNDSSGFNLGARRFTISTVGVVPMINRFAEEKRQVNLAISLHAANDELRSSLLPVNKKYPLNELIAACRNYIALTNRRLTFEWALIDGVNDSEKDALELCKLIHGLLCHVNVIPLNPTEKYPGKATTREKAEVFKQTLEKSGIPCTIRLRRGIDIQAGCGQLASKAR